MIMRQYNRGSVRQNRWLKNLARMHDRRGETADRYRIDANNAILLIKENDGEMLPIHIGKVRMQQRCCVNSTANLLVVAWYPTFSHQRDFVNRNTRLFPLSGGFIAKEGQLLTGCGLSIFHGQWLPSCIYSIGGVEQDISYSTRALWLLLVAPLTISHFV